MNTPAAQQQTDYLTSLGLQRAPFLDQIDDRFFYADPQLVQRLDLLQHLIQFGDMLLGVSGPAGSGKSTLLQQLLRRGGTTWRSCRLNGGQIQQPGDLLTQLADGFGLDRGAAPERLRADLLRLFQTLRHTSLIPVVVVDDAHLLPEPALKALLELAGELRETLKLLRVVLFSEPGLEQRLIQAGLHSPLQPLLHNLDLPRFDDHQTAAYLMYRLAVAGYSGESPFSLTEIRALHKSADGLPGKLNVLAHETLMERAGRLGVRRNTPEAKPGATRRRPWLILGSAAAILALGAVGGYLLTRPTDEAAVDLQALPESVPPEPPSEQLPETAGAAAEPAAQTDARMEAAPPPPQTPDATTPVTAPPADQTVAADTGQITADDSATGTDTGTPAGGALPPAQEAAPAAADESAGTPTEQPAARAEAEAPAETRGQVPAPTTAAPAAEQPRPEETAPPAQRPTAAATGEDAAPPAAEAEAETKAETAATKTTEPPQKEASDETQAPARATAAAAEPVPPLPADVFTAEWLLERPAGHYTLQLLAVRNPASLRGYLRDHAIPAPVAVFRTRLKGSDWYVLVQGDYPSMGAARAAVAGLPAGVRKSKPWPRSFASVHTDLRKASP